MYKSPTFQFTSINSFSSWLTFLLHHLLLVSSCARHYTARPNPYHLTNTLPFSALWLIRSPLWGKPSEVVCTHFLYNPLARLPCFLSTSAFHGSHWSSWWQASATRLLSVLFCFCLEGCQGARLAFSLARCLQRHTHRAPRTASRRLPSPAPFDTHLGTTWLFVSDSPPVAYMVTWYSLIFFSCHPPCSSLTGFLMI